MSKREAIATLLIARFKGHGVNEDDAVGLLKIVENELSTLTDADARNDQAIVDDMLRSIGEYIASQPVASSIKESAREDALKILFIGNSLTYENNLPLALANLLISGATVEPGTSQEESRPLKIYQVVQAGMTLEDHWNSKVACRVLYQKGPWDFVVLQEQSIRSLEEPAKMFDYGQSLGAEIKKAGAKILIYAAWPRSDKLDSLGQINWAFKSLSSQLDDAVIVPAGDCWAQASKKNKKLELYNDLIHPSQAGTYLTACAFYAVLTATSPSGLPEKLCDHDGAPFIELTRKVALELQQIAWETVSSQSI